MLHCIVSYTRMPSARPFETRRNGQNEKRSKREMVKTRGMVKIKLTCLLCCVTLYRIIFMHALSGPARRPGQPPRRRPSESLRLPSHFVVLRSIVSSLRMPSARPFETRRNGQNEKWSKREEWSKRVCMPLARPFETRHPPLGPGPAPGPRAGTKSARPGPEARPAALPGPF